MDITVSETTASKEKTMIERRRWMSKVKIKRDPMIEAMIKLDTTSRPTKRDRSNTTLEVTKLRKDNLNAPTTPSKPTEKSSLNKLHRKRKSRINNNMDIVHGVPLILQRSLPHTNVKCIG